PAFNRTLDERAARIQGGIEKAERVQAEADQALAEYQKQLADGRAEAARLRAEAQEEGAQIIADMKAQAHTEADRIIESAQTQINAERQSAMVQLRSEVGTLATDLASRIVGESLTDDERSANVDDRSIAALESGSSPQPVKAAGRTTRADCRRMRIRSHPVAALCSPPIATPPRTHGRARGRDAPVEQIVPAGRPRNREFRDLGGRPTPDR